MNRKIISLIGIIAFVTLLFAETLVANDKSKKGVPSKSENPGMPGIKSEVEEIKVQLRRLRTIVRLQQLQIEELTEQVKTNSAAIQKNSQDIDANAGETATLAAALGEMSKQVQANTDDILVNKNQIVALEQGIVPGLGMYVRVEDEPLNGLSGPHIIFEGANVHVQSGSGLTDDGNNLTGLGNLVVGYNEEPLDVDPDRGGSHNLVIGPEHNYPNSGGFVTGFANTISGDFASVAGGAFNVASGQAASVVGGQQNIASGDSACLSGGLFNLASGSQASVSGGLGNTASGFGASVSGGQNNEARGTAHSVVGDEGNVYVDDKIVH